MTTATDEVVSGARRWHVECADATAYAMTLPKGCIQTVMTSPPYFGLRDYETGEWVGGDSNCDHAREKPRFNSPKQTTAQVSGHASLAEKNARGKCHKCGAVLERDLQIGSEKSPGEFIDRLVGLFANLRDPLADDGVMFVNLGDSYANDTKWGGNGSGPGTKNYTSGEGGCVGQKAKRLTGLPPKSLMAMPWRFAIAMQDDGWTLRNDIIWAKPNPMPESVTDRFTKSHEYIFFFSKKPRYFFDADAIQEPAVCAGQNRGGSTKRYEQNAAGMDNRQYETRNKRSVWTVQPSSFKGAHFATYPAELIEPCILAGSREGDIVYDPFAGSGTTIAVAVEHGRRGLGSELNPAYMKLIHKRMRGVTPSMAISA